MVITRSSIKCGSNPATNPVTAANEVVDKSNVRVTRSGKYLDTTTPKKAAAPKKAAEDERRITRSYSRNQQQQPQATKSKSKNEKPEIQEPVQQKSPEKMTRDERRRNEALMELKTLGKVASLVVCGHRRRKQAEHQDAAFVLASLKQFNDAGTKGGLVRGSRHHYERSY